MNLRKSGDEGKWPIPYCCRKTARFFGLKAIQSIHCGNIFLMQPQSHFHSLFLILSQVGLAKVLPFWLESMILGKLMLIFNIRFRNSMENEKRELSFEFLVGCEKSPM